MNEFEKLTVVADVAALVLPDLATYRRLVASDHSKGIITESTYQSIKARHDALDLALIQAGYTRRDKYTNFLSKPEKPMCNRTLDLFKRAPTA